MNIVTFAETPYEHTLVQNRWGFRPADSSDFAQHLEGACSRGERSPRFPIWVGIRCSCRPATRAGRPQSNRGPTGPSTSGRTHMWRHQRAPTATSPRSRETRPQAQAAAFWAKVGSTYESLVAQKGDRPVWLSTEGSGVPWLHVRMDARPKYHYHTAHYKGKVMFTVCVRRRRRCCLRGVERSQPERTGAAGFAGDLHIEDQLGGNFPAGKR